MKLAIHGQKDPFSAQGATLDANLLKQLGCTAVEAYRVGLPRAGGTLVHTDSLAPHDVVELDFGDGFCLWLNPDELPEKLHIEPVRGLGRQDDVLVVPTIMRTGDLSRGIGAWIVKAVRIFKFGTDRKDPVELTADAAARWAQKKQVEKPGLYRWSSDGSLTHVIGKLPPSTSPLLMFLHGTASSTLGSFGELLTGEHKDPHVPTAEWLKLRATYGDNIFALEHWTLTESPIQNAIDLLDVLPPDTELHLVSHSRGGLIGELMCRYRRILENTAPAGNGGPTFAPPFTENELLLFEKHGQKEIADKLTAMLKSKRPYVSRFVRVACPARGTVLAGDRFDVWLSVLLNVIGWSLPPGSSNIYDVLKAFVLAVVKERKDPDSLPGLQAMIPDSAFQRIINHPQAQVDADLFAICGDLEGGGILGRLKQLPVDLFYSEDHDLVVNTRAMDGGTSRLNGKWIIPARGPEVSHFNYFLNRQTAEQVVEGLLRKVEPRPPPEPTPTEKPRALSPIVRSHQGGDRPIVFVLPGIMGTHLTIGTNRIWIDYTDLALGGVRKLAIDRPGISPEGLVAKYYDGIVSHLSKTHTVIPFPYDWRRSIAHEAVRFGASLHDHLSQSRHPVRILAHSMGGLVARAAFAQDPGLWESFKSRGGARLLMLGTPNGGSHSIVMMLMGRDRVAKALRTLDITMSGKEQLAVTSRFPGVLDLLPLDPNLDLFSTESWKSLQSVDKAGDEWALPEATDLANARDLHALLGKAPFDPEIMLYIAGLGPTVDGVHIHDDGVGRKILFTRTPEGDGRVPWNTGILPGMPVWYVEAEHGDLPRHAPAFPGIMELLEKGTTASLPNQRPVARAGTRPLPPMEQDALDSYPDEADLTAVILGGKAAPPMAVLSTARTRLRVTHANLAFNRYPLMVGHYAGDALHGAEKGLDTRLGGRLQRRWTFGIYPGPLNSSDVILDDDNAPGAIIVGLGDPGQITLGALADTLGQALLRYAAARMDQAPGERASLTISTVLIGAGSGGLPLPACVEALLRAIERAQAALGDGGFQEVEIIELYEDRAVQIFREIARRLDNPPADPFDMDGEVHHGEGGKRRLPEEDEDWWQPMTIRTEMSGGRSQLHFTLATPLARAEASLVPTQKEFIDSFVRHATTAVAMDIGYGTPGRTLFEMLLPDGLKVKSGGDRNIRLVLDEDSAAYPWELLDDRRPWASTEKPSEHRLPPAVRSGMVRQLIRHNFREQVMRPRGRGKALIIGDPVLGTAQNLFPALDGAVHEANTVAARLANHGLLVTRLIRTDATTIVQAFSAQDWQIVHIAAHGIVEDDGRIGIVLGDGYILTADMLGQVLPVAPDLVFLNCCHLGNLTESGLPSGIAAPGSVLVRERNRLAANLAVKLIDIGVRCVVAAGWAVDDAAAASFAENFYNCLFRARNSLGLGQAAKEARADVYKQFPGSTTWGAYQIYGAPEWRPRPPPDTVPETALRYVSVVEAINAGDEIRQDAQNGIGGDLARWIDRLDCIEAAAKTYCWMKEARLLHALATANAELGRIDKALDLYGKALQADPAAAPVQAIEQMANLAVRKAARDARLSGEADAAIRSIKDQIVRLINLRKTLNVPDTQERLGMLGGCHKRLAGIATGMERTEALRHMADWYRKCRKFDPETPLGRNARLLQMSAELALALGKPGYKAEPNALCILESAAASAARLDAAAPHFWNAVALGDALLLRHMALEDRRLSMPKENETQRKAREDQEAREVEAIRAAYVRGWKRGSSPLKMRSVLEQLEFLIDVLDTDALAPLRQRLLSIHRALEVETALPI